MYSKLTPMERLAARVSEKIEDSDVMGAVRLAASDDMVATYCQETIDELGQRLLTLLTEFANICLCRRVPVVVRPVFCGPSLCALSKKRRWH